MAPPTLPDPDEIQDDAQWRTAGDRIQTLLQASSSGGAVARERAEQLVREVTDLYGAALERMMAVVSAAQPEVAGRLAADDLVASLLLVHGLHPHAVERRVAQALDSVRPYLGSHGGDVALLGVDDGLGGYTVRLQFQGSCKSCPSSSDTLELAVEDAVRAAAPEVESIEVVASEEDSSRRVIPAEALMSRLHQPTAWQPVPELAELSDGEIGGFRVMGATVLVCRLGGNVYAYRDRCPHCTATLAGAQLSGVVLRCPSCGAGFDVVRAGAGLGGDGRLEPIPVLVRDGVLAMAIPQEVA
ncbi:NifU family protein [Mycolicibacterium holsaticum]|uniref:NifU family protein n=1 Tax=Mycolicibacterium holsaticum TaxID=152142 RepID=UPI001C7DB291|nr:NifU family protein [Mycolicibacterium holsaticum]MDA4109819.1 nitrogen-fixing protein NifU [Mycolicibacterium holsaticum DSM 44478 = JCM 12374]QZA10730.1 NifU family protein [Mycolicibacterium holsaticum DSM 44478 = JCM 12374]UNC11771.1 NifU family protein [Mycolicibacterium holsaticum DSM 44478 = JCM 12374]